MKKFNAREIRDQATIFWRTVDREEKVEIVHERYPDRRFFMVATDKEIKKDAD